MISTGLQKLDKFLSGGIPKNVIVDVFGENGTGKTLFLLQLSINSIKNGGNVLYLDTTGGFRPERIIEIQKELEIEMNLFRSQSKTPVLVFRTMRKKPYLNDLNRLRSIRTVLKQRKEQVLDWRLPKGLWRPMGGKSGLKVN